MPKMPKKASELAGVLLDRLRRVIQRGDERKQIVHEEVILLPHVLAAHEVTFFGSASHVKTSTR